jgi:hypothetical protein
VNFVDYLDPLIQHLFFLPLMFVSKQNCLKQVELALFFSPSIIFLVNRGGFFVRQGHCPCATIFAQAFSVVSLSII